MVPVETPREMTQKDIEQFRVGAANAITAGFDGVEIHGANGYLIDPFLRSNSNLRTDGYGGCQANRVRLLSEITKAVAAEAGAERTGVRLSPFISFKDMDDPEILETIMLAAAALDQIGVTYIHLCEADWDDAPDVPDSFQADFRARFSNTIIATGNCAPQKADRLLGANYVDVVGFGRKFLANPDYPERVRRGAALNEITNTHSLFDGAATPTIYLSQSIVHPVKGEP